MIPNVTQNWLFKDHNTIPLDAFDKVGLRPVRVRARAWYDMGCDAPDLVLTPQMIQRTMLRNFPTLARFEIRENRQEKLDTVVEDRGLLPNRWFCV